MKKLSRHCIAATSVIICFWGAQAAGAQATGDSFLTFGDSLSYPGAAWRSLEKGAEDAARKGHTGEAEFLFTEALKFAQHSPSRKEQRFTTLHHLAKLYSDYGLTDKAFYNYDHALCEYTSLQYDETSPRSTDTFSEYTAMLKEWIVLAKKSGTDISFLNRRLEKALEWHKVSEERRKLALRQERELQSSLADIDFGPYMAALQRKIRENWSPLPSDCMSNSRVIVEFQVHANGSVTKIRLHSPTDSYSINRAATQAIALSAPFAHLPKGAPAVVDIQYTFDINRIVYPHCEKRRSAKHSKH